MPSQRYLDHRSSSVSPSGIGSTATWFAAAQTESPSLVLIEILNACISTNSVDCLPRNLVVASLALLAVILEHLELTSQEYRTPWNFHRNLMVR